MKNIIIEAHRGVSSDYPENTLAAFRAAVKLGYGMIELDPKFTADDRCVILHDRTINRTARLADGTGPVSDLPIASLTLDEARAYDYGSWFGSDFKGEPLPTLEDTLSFALEAKIPLKLDNVIFSFTDTQLSILFDTIAKYGAQDLVGFTAASTGDIKKVLARFPDAAIHYDGIVDDAALEELSALVKPDRLTIWMRYDNRITAWNTTPPVSKAWADRIHPIAKLGVWLITEPDELRTAVDYGADLVETDGRLKP